MKNFKFLRKNNYEENILISGYTTMSLSTVSGQTFISSSFNDNYIVGVDPVEFNTSSPTVLFRTETTQNTNLDTLMRRVGGFRNVFKNIFSQHR